MLFVLIFKVYFTVEYFLKICFIFNYLYLCMSMCDYVHVNTDHVELESHTVVSHLMWLLETEFWSIPFL